MHKKIMIVVDDDTLADAVVQEGLALAKSFAAEVFFFYFIPITMAKQGGLLGINMQSQEELQFREKARATEMLAVFSSAAQANGVHSHCEILIGANAAAAIEIVADAESCDMVVIGSHGRTPIQRFIYGSLPADLLPLLPMPMVVCKSRSEKESASS